MSLKNKYISILKPTIGRKIFMYMFLFTIVIIGIIGIGTRFILPTYYLNQQLDYLESSESTIRQAYEEGKIDIVIEQMEAMENELGGELYYFSDTSGQQSYGMGKGKNRTVNNNSEKFIASGDVSAYEYTNKIGLDIHVLGVLMDENYLVYEVSVQTLNQATSTMMDFIAVLLVVVLILAVMVSIVLSQKISKPIRDLNVLAEQMKSKEIEPIMVTKEVNEISQLNGTLNELYEELRGSIYKLNTELHKERNSEKLKKRFLAQATHELKTPIAVIRGYSEILYDGMYKDEEERDRFLKNIYDETEAVSHLILDVLDYTKMETGNYKLNIEDIAIQPYLSQLFERYKDFVESQKLSFLLEESIDEGLHMSIDRVRYEQIYKNLISNAVEHGKTQVLTKVESLGHRLKLTVYNDGNPISEEDLPNVFESFYKKAGKKKGTGLGLAIVKEIVLLHKGEYWAKNTEKGVEFVIIV